MSQPGYYKHFISDRFGIIRTQLSLPAETHGQKRILTAWKEARKYVRLLDEYTQAIHRRGIFSDDAIVWYIQDYERGDFWEDVQKGYREFGESLKKLNDAMVETARLRCLPGKERRVREWLLGDDEGFLGGCKRIKTYSEQNVRD